MASGNARGGDTSGARSAVGWPLSLAVAVLRVVPKALLSRLAGRIASLRLPAPLQRLEIALFGRTVGVDFDEVRDPIGSFASMQDFFTRQLRAGVRPVDSASAAFVAPCDGAWGASGRIEDGMLLQVKGSPYSAAALLGDAELAAGFGGGVFATFYLSPRDYHRFHMPCDARVVEARYLPGSLWPVNAIGVEGIAGLFAKNERISAVMQPDAAAASGRLCIVAVGATLVGKIRVEFDDLTTNVPGVAGCHRRYAEASPRFAKGQEWGRFEFGSTLVLLATPGLLELDVKPSGSLLRLGERIGTLSGGSPSAGSSSSDTPSSDVPPAGSGSI